MLKKISLLVLVVVFPSLTSLAQDSARVSPISITGYADAYYAYYTDSVGAGNYQKFPSVSPRSDNFGLNTAHLNFQYDAEKVRGTVTLHFGDITRSAWSDTFNSIMEAHAGVRLSKKIWIDAGFFRTHVGTEGLLPKENITSSVSVCTFYEPYFESGIRLNYVASDKLTINLFVLNGYNIYEENNKKKSAGVLATYTFNDKLNIGYSNYVGDDSPEGLPVSYLRIYQNLFINYQLNKLKIQAGGDVAVQENSDFFDTKKSAMMYSGVAALKYQFTSKFAAYTRGEIFNDDQGFMSGIIIDKKSIPTGFKLIGFTAGVEYKPTDNSYIRFEGRQLQMDKDQEIFWWNGNSESTRMEAMINMGVSF